MKEKSKYNVGELVEFGYFNGKNITRHCGEIAVVDRMITGFEYDIMEKSTNTRYKHIEEKIVYGLAEKDKNIKVEFTINSVDMHIFKLEHCRKTDIPSEYIFEERNLRYENAEREAINVSFEVENSYEVLDRLGEYWGGWNDTPQSRHMAEVAKDWHEKYSAELIKVSHDMLTFSCRELTESEAIELTNDAALLCAETEINESRTCFELWWD